MRTRRTLLYVPGSDWHKVQKAAGLGADSVCIDLEDGVALNAKTEARANVQRALQELDFGTSERLVRINAVGSGLEQDDLQAALGGRPDGIVIPKAADAAQVRSVSTAITFFERQHALPEDGIRLIAQIESAIGLVNLKEIASADPRLDALIFGSEDFASDVGAQRTPGGEEIFFARSSVAVHAAAFGLQAIDMLWIDYTDTAGLERVAREGARLGYSGMQIVHPAQIEPVRRAFTPTAEEVTWAQRVASAYEENLRAGRGAFGLDGKMIDMPVVKAAQRVLARTGK